MRLSLVLFLSLGLFCTLQAEPFFGDSQNPAFGYRGTSRRVVYQTAMLVPRTAPRASRPDTDDPEDREPAPPAPPSNAGPTVPGNRAVLRRGIAYAPSNAPDRVKEMIWAVNTLRNKPYKWGGGHGSFQDSGYDCSGTVSFALHHARALNQPMASKELQNFGNRGTGRWITVYSRSGHAFAVVAGLRLDTTGFYEKDGPRWRASQRSPRGFSARHPEGL